MSIDLDLVFPDRVCWEQQWPKGLEIAMFHVLKIVRGFAGDGPGRLLLSLLRSWSPEHIQVSLAAMGNDGPLFDEMVTEISRLNGKVYSIPEGWMELKKASARIVEIAREQNITHLHSHLLRPDMAARPAADETGLPYLVTEHGVHGWGEKGPFLRPVVKSWYRKNLKGQKLVCAISEKVKADLEAEGISSKHIVVVRNGIEVKDFSVPTFEERAAAREGLGLTVTDYPLLVMVGSLIPRKAPLSAVRMLKEMAPMFPNTRLYFAGDGPLRGDIERSAEQLGVLSQIRLGGFRSDPRAVYRAGDLMLHPALDEPFGLVVAEAMACGLPVMVREGAGADAFIPDEPLAYKVLGKSPVEWVDPIIRAVKMDGRNRDKLAALRHDYAKKHLDVWQMADRYLKVYARLVKEEK